MFQPVEGLPANIITSLDDLSELDERALDLLVQLFSVDGGNETRNAIASVLFSGALFPKELTGFMALSLLALLEGDLTTTA
jgi:hypothetical protein